MDVPTLSNEEALELTRRGASVLALGLPPGRDFGLDLRSCTVGDKFLGMKMIPAGLHLLVFGTDADRTGVFLRLAPSEVHATRWSAETELLLPIFGPEAGALAAETRGFQHDAGMAPYPLGTWDDWRNLAGEIDEGVLGRAGLRVGGLVAPSVAAEEVVGGGAVGGGQTEEGVGGLSVADGRPEGRGRVGNSEEGGGEGSAASVSATEASPVDSGAGSGGGCRGMGGGKNVAAGGGVSGERAAPAPSDLSARSEPRFAPMDPRALRADGRRGTGGRVGRELTSFLLDRSEWLAQLLREEYGGGGEEGAAGVDSAQMDFDGVAERAENAGGGTRFGREMAAPAPPAAHSPSSLTPSESSLLGDLQLSFLLFLRLACLHSLEAWKGRVHLLCSCDAALVNRQAFYTRFLHTLRAQLSFAPSDFFEHELSADNFLRSSLTSLAARVASAEGAEPPLRAEMGLIHAFLAQRFKLDLGAGEEEDEPVVVQL